MTQETHGQIKGTLNLLFQSHGLANSLDDKIFELLTMLTPLEPLKRHQDIKLPRTQGAGTWLLNLECFHKWQNCEIGEESSGVFCCYGIPGAGKTVIWYWIQSSIPFVFIVPEVANDRCN